MLPASARGDQLSNLVNALVPLFERTGDAAVLKEAVTMGRRSSRIFGNAPRGCGQEVIGFLPVASPAGYWSSATGVLIGSARGPCWSTGRWPGQWRMIGAPAADHQQRSDVAQRCSLIRNSPVPYLHSALSGKRRTCHICAARVFGGMVTGSWHGAHTGSCARLRERLV